MDANACRATLARLIGEDIDALTQLMGLLDIEHGYLLANDVTALQEAMRRRQGCVTRILRVDQERAALCRVSGRANSLAGLTQLMRWCDPEGSLAAQWGRCAQLAGQAQQLNDRNGALVGARLKHVQDRLGTLLDNRRGTHTYGRRGQETVMDSGRLLAAEA